MRRPGKDACTLRLTVSVAFEIRHVCISHDHDYASASSVGTSWYSSAKMVSSQTQFSSTRQQVLSPVGRTISEQNV